MATTTQQMTAEQFYELPDEPGMQYELVEGELVTMASPEYRHSMFAETIGDIIKVFARPQKLGNVGRDNTAYILRRNPATVRVPDVSFVRRERVIAAGAFRGHFSGAPDLAVEIVSPSDRMPDLHAKARDYIAAGTQLVWIIQPNNQTVTVYAADGTTRDYVAGETLDGGDVLPGFSVLVAELFVVNQW